MVVETLTIKIKTSNTLTREREGEKGRRRKAGGEIPPYELWERKDPEASGTVGLELLLLVAHQNVIVRPYC